MSLKIAYIGAGGFTNHFIFPQLRRHDVELAAVCDLDEEKAATAQRQYGFGKVYTDFRQMLETEKPDAVFCVGGPKVHYPVGMEVLDRGFPLYVQKPPAPSSEATREMADVAARRGVVCHVGFNLRTAPAFLQARRIMNEEPFGAPLLGIFRYGLCSDPTMEGYVMDQHVHLTDLARYMLGEVEEATALKTGRAEGKDYVVAVRFASGAVGTLNFASGQPIEKEFIYLEITGEDSVLISHGVDELLWKRSYDVQPWWKSAQPDWHFRHGGFGFNVTLESFGYLGDVDNFLGAVRGEQKDLSPIADTVGSVALCEEILRQIGPQPEGGKS